MTQFQAHTLEQLRYNNLAQNRQRVGWLISTRFSTLSRMLGQGSDSFRQRVSLPFSYCSHVQQGGGTAKRAEQGCRGCRGSSHATQCCTAAAPHSHSQPRILLSAPHLQATGKTLIAQLCLRSMKKMHTHQLTEPGQRNPWCRCSYTNKTEPHLAAVVPLIELSVCTQGDVITEVNTPRKKKTNAWTRKKQTLSQQSWKSSHFENRDNPEGRGSEMGCELTQQCPRWCCHMSSTSPKQRAWGEGATGLHNLLLAPVGAPRAQTQLSPSWGHSQPRGLQGRQRQSALLLRLNCPKTFSGETRKCLAVREQRAGDITVRLSFVSSWDFCEKGNNCFFFLFFFFFKPKP